MEPLIDTPRAAYPIDFSDSNGSDLRAIARLVAARTWSPTTVMMDGRILLSLAESGARWLMTSVNNAKAAKCICVDTLGHLIVIKVTAASEQERAQVADLALQVQEATGNHVELAYVDQGFTGQQAQDDAKSHRIRLKVVKLSEAKKGFVLLPRRWVVERSFGWAARFKRLSRDYERLALTLTAFHWLAFSTLLLSSIIKS
jgi:transposase